MKKAVILLSGGLDSTTCLACAKSRGFECFAMSFDYGQRHGGELTAAKNIAKHFAAKHHLIFSLNPAVFAGSALTDSTLTVPPYSTETIIPVTYVPARNTIFLSLALGWGETLKASSLFMGASCVDYSHYPDCRPAYFEAFANLAKLATKSGVEGHSISIETPLLHLSKAQTIQLGLSLGVDYGMTVSCYSLDEAGRACGACDSCILRKKGFLEAGVRDPTHYCI